MITPKEMAAIYWKNLKGKALIELEAVQKSRHKAKAYWQEVIDILRRLH